MQSCTACRIEVHTHERTHDRPTDLPLCRALESCLNAIQHGKCDCMKDGFGQDACAETFLLGVGRNLTLFGRCEYLCLI